MSLIGGSLKGNVQGDQIISSGNEEIVIKAKIYEAKSIVILWGNVMVCHFCR